MSTYFLPTYHEIFNASLSENFHDISTLANFP